MLCTSDSPFDKGNAQKDMALVRAPQVRQGGKINAGAPEYQQGLNSR